MLDVALKDEKISEDEHSLLESISKKYGIYEECFFQSMKDGIISDEETKLLKEIRKDIYKSALETALRDNRITDKELEILNILRDSVGLPDEVLCRIEEELSRKKAHYEKLKRGG